MLDVGWTEILVIAIVLIVVVGPKDLPQMLRTFGRMVTKMRGMAGEFRQQFDEALREADMDDVRKTLADAQKLNPLNTIRDAVNPLRQVGTEIKADLEKATKPPTPATPAAAEQKPAAETPAEVAPPVAVPAELPKPAASEPVAAAPLKTGAVARTEPAVKIAKPRRTTKAKVEAAADADKPAPKKTASGKSRTKKDEA